MLTFHRGYQFQEAVKNKWAESQRETKDKRILKNPNVGFVILSLVKFKHLQDEFEKFSRTHTTLIILGTSFKFCTKYK